jgi:hypothetical protein
LDKCIFDANSPPHQGGIEIGFDCNEEPLASGFCIFHDKDYLEDKTNPDLPRRKLVESLECKVNQAKSRNEPLVCIGYLLPEIKISETFSNNVFFQDATFHGKADFSSISSAKGVTPGLE